MDDNRCVCCGEIIPEGMIACPNCLVVSKKTNADKIREMTDEELAKELARVAGWDRSQYKKAKTIGIEKVMLDWLLQPAVGGCYEAN